MIVEWLLITLLIVGTGFLFFRAPTPGGLRLWGALFVLAVLATAWVWQARLNRNLESRARLNAPEIGRPGEYAGSDSCRACHPDQYLLAPVLSPHHDATRHPGNGPRQI